MIQWPLEIGALQAYCLCGRRARDCDRCGEAKALQRCTVCYVAGPRESVLAHFRERHLAIVDDHDRQVCSLVEFMRHPDKYAGSAHRLACQLGHLSLPSVDADCAEMHAAEDLELRNALVDGAVASGIITRAQGDQVRMDDLMFTTGPLPEQELLRRMEAMHIAEVFPADILPEEIWEVIARNLDIRSLLRLRATSWRFRSIVDGVDPTVQHIVGATTYAALRAALKHKAPFLTVQYLLKLSSRDGYPIPPGLITYSASAALARDKGPDLLRQCFRAMLERNERELYAELWDAVDLFVNAGNEELARETTAAFFALKATLAIRSSFDSQSVALSEDGLVEPQEPSLAFGRL